MAEFGTSNWLNKNDIEESLLVGRQISTSKYTTRIFKNLTRSQQTHCLRKKDLLYQFAKRCSNEYLTGLCRTSGKHNGKVYIGVLKGDYHNNIASEDGEKQKMGAKCLFSKLNAVDCGFSNFYNDTKQFYKLNECEKNTDAHLRSLHSYNLNSDVSESTLILSRVGAVFNYSCTYNICQAHRDTLGIYWQRSNRNGCKHPLHGSSKRKAERGISLKRPGEDVPIGSAICRGCREEHSKELSKFTFCDEDNEESNIEDDEPKEKKICLSSEVVCRLSVTDGNCLRYGICTTCNDSVKVGKVTLKTSRERVDIPDTDSTETEEQDEEDTEAVNSIGFACPEPGCQREFVSANGLERHILNGSHEYVKPAGTDVVKQMWVDKCNNIGSEYKSVIDQSVISGSEDDSVVEGWALKKNRKVVRFSPQIKIFLKNIYDEGERTGKRPYYDDLCDRLRKQRTENGTKMFSPDEWLSVSQIKSLFAGFASKQHSRRDIPHALHVVAPDQVDVNDVELRNVLSEIKNWEIQEKMSLLTDKILSTELDPFHADTCN
ncbi:Hypothetical predicted protein [Mytilus galloprovincialis]|uniref:C2H2-type domain-containing protein n=1 Tax=Mytilus galloprovincialis TaxID=29158 RepID=A0A8B6G6A6_MYTGA|nr:Hypothetical predicted protein [Mytilus galloprovincialis]